MKREAVAVLLGLALGLLAGLAWQGHRAAGAEAHAHRADALYRVTLARDSLHQRERDAFDQLRRLAQTHADSVSQAAEDSVVAVRQRAATTTRRAVTALAAAQTLRDTADTYRSLYEDAAGQRDAAFRVIEAQHRAAGELRAMLAADTVEIGKERQRTAEWKRAADSLAAANADLLKHRRPEFGWKVGVGGLVAGGIVTEILRAVVTR